MYKDQRLFILTALAMLIALSLSCQVTSTPAVTQAPSIAPMKTEPPAVVQPPTQVPTNTKAPEPTQPPPTKQPSCYKWDQITLDMAGQTVCAYGVAYSHEGQHRIDFSPEKNSFFLVDPVYYYPNLKEGTCMVAKEKVEIFDGKIPFMTIKNGLYYCEPWMEE